MFGLRGYVRISSLSLPEEHDPGYTVLGTVLRCVS